MTSWTKSKALSQRTRRVTSFRGLPGLGLSPSSQASSCAVPGHPGPHLSWPQPWSCSAHSTCHLCVADGLYRQSAPEFRVASSVEQLNIIEVGARVAEGKGGGRWSPGLPGEGPRHR